MYRCNGFAGYIHFYLYALFLFLLYQFFQAQIFLLTVSFDIKSFITLTILNFLVHIDQYYRIVQSYLIKYSA